MVTPQDFVNRFFSNKTNQLFLPWLSFNSGPLSVQELLLSMQVSNWSPVDKHRCEVIQKMCKVLINDSSFSIFCPNILIPAKF